MPRSVPEWIGRRPEAMPPDGVKLRIVERQNRICACGCGWPMNYDTDAIDFDHKVALIDGGENVEANIQALLRVHHRVKTSAEATARSEERRHKAKAFAHLKKPGFQTNRNAKFKRLMNGTTVLRSPNARAVERQE